MTNIREVAYDTLLAYEREELGNDFLNKVLEKYAYLDKQDRSFLKRLCEGTIERRITIDHVLSLYSKVPVNKMKAPVRTIVRLGVYQIMYMDAVPDSAACNEMVKLAKKRGLANLAGFVNGVLRNVARNKDSIKYPDKESDLIKYLSVYYSCPEWIVELIINEHGEDGIAVLANSVSVRPITARVNISKAKIEEIIAKNPENIEKNPVFDYAVSLHNINRVGDLTEIQDGRIVVQDIASMLPAHIAGIKDDDTVIDVCASPGGKSLHAADLAINGKVIACDVSEDKVDRIRDNVTRCRFNNVEAMCADATVYHEELRECADVLIADVPCSGLGVMGRKNDIKYRLKPSQLEDLSKLQRKIIDNVISYLKPGGTLVYSTCTVNNAENFDNYRYIIDDKKLRPVDFYDKLPDLLKDETAKSGYLQLLGKDGLTDGFFISKFIKG